MSLTDHVVGIGTCTRGMTIPSHLSSEMHLQKFPDQTKFQSWILNSRTEICAKAKNLALERRVVIQGTGQRSLHWAEDWRKFSTIGSCSRSSFLHTHATGHHEMTWKEVGDARRSHLEQAFSSVPKVKE